MWKPVAKTWKFVCFHKNTNGISWSRNIREARDTTIVYFQGDNVAWSLFGLVPLPISGSFSWFGDRD